jgi:hypothetical protein
MIATNVGAVMRRTAEVALLSEVLANWSTYELDDSIYLSALELPDLETPVTIFACDPKRPRVFEGKHYFLGIEQVRDVIDGLEEQLRRPASLVERLRAVIHYAEHDAFIDPQALVDVLANFNRRPPTDADSIRRLEAEAGFRLPEDYADFLKKSDGGEGFIGRAYVIFWSAGELLELNRAYEVDQFAPGLFLFGSDGGGEGFAFDRRSDGRPIVSVPFVGMELEVAKDMGNSFEEFLANLSRL